MKKETIINHFQLLNHYRLNNLLDSQYENWFQILSNEIEPFLKFESEKLYCDPKSEYNYILENPFSEEVCDYFWEEAVFSYLQEFKKYILISKFEFDNLEKLKNYLKTGLKNEYLKKNDQIRRKGISKNLYPRIEHEEFDQNIKLELDTIDDYITEEEKLNRKRVTYTNLERELEQSKNRNKRVIKYINALKLSFGENVINEIFSKFEKQRFLEKCLELFYSFNRYGNWNDVIQYDERFTNRRNNDDTGPIRNKSKNCSSEIDDFIQNVQGGWTNILIKNGRNRY
jgi:hypothetical protein